MSKHRKCSVSPSSLVSTAQENLQATADATNVRLTLDFRLGMEDAARRRRWLGAVWKMP